LASADPKLLNFKKILFILKIWLFTVSFVQQSRRARLITSIPSRTLATISSQDKKHLKIYSPSGKFAERAKNVGPIRHCEPPHAHSPDVTTGTVARRLRIDVHDNNARQRGPLWPHGMGPMIEGPQRMLAASDHCVGPAQLTNGMLFLGA